MQLRLLRLVPLPQLVLLLLLLPLPLNSKSLDPLLGQVCLFCIDWYSYLDILKHIVVKFWAVALGGRLVAERETDLAGPLDDTVVLVGHVVLFGFVVKGEVVLLTI